MTHEESVEASGQVLLFSKKEIRAADVAIGKALAGHVQGPGFDKHH